MALCFALSRFYSTELELSTWAGQVLRPFQFPELLR
ncbi:hypothetical protein COLO4_21723 [Corchorus olitorius]|uniref:Uncharacterized protein n=1 Tax=Corchorus olitorius TaxID=93759 RepID=A0A1R3IRP3_9ROSI|nr:hypothetical protein COLO4_21723 [Corchorus olitorius]